MQDIHRVKGDTAVICHPCWDEPFNARRQLAGVVVHHVVPRFELSLSFVASGITLESSCWHQRGLFDDIDDFKSCMLL